MKTVTFYSLRSENEENLQEIISSDKLKKKKKVTGSTVKETSIYCLIFLKPISVKLTKTKKIKAFVMSTTIAAQTQLTL